MAKRSLKASTAGMEKATKAFQKTGWTQEYLAAEAGLSTRQAIWKFLTGKPIERHFFIELCFRLGLDWEEIAEQKYDSHSDISALVQRVRSHRYDKIQSQCGTMRLLDVAQPININDIYVSVNILESLSRQRWLDVFDLQSFNSSNFHRFGLGKIVQSRVAGFQAVHTYPKLMILGKPGSGKTTFLQKIAIQCNHGDLHPDKIPIFIRLKNLLTDIESSEPAPLLHYIRQEISSSNISEQQVETLLQHGSVLLLLDGLDEVPADEAYQVLKQIRQLAEEHYKNQFIITCRLAAKQYQFEGFTDIEIADFDLSQIEAFAQKWFVTVGKNEADRLDLPRQFMEKLQLPENLPLRELAVTPILLNLTCSVFQAKADFPAKRSDLYKQGLDILLSRWDETRGIKRDYLYRDLSLLQKLKLLSQLAATTFEQGKYFFESSTMQQYIANYLQTLPDSGSAEPDALQLNSETVLQAIEVQHGLLVERARGIYSFSHLTFQEYLTARNIVANPEPEILNKNLNNLVSHITETRWREVFLLTAGLLGNADALIELMKQQVDEMIARDGELQQFLIWLAQKSVSVQVPYKAAATRAFYLTLSLGGELNLGRDLKLALALDLSLAGNLAPELNLDLALARVLTLSLTMADNVTLDRMLAISFALPMPDSVRLSPLGESLQHLKKQLPTPDEGTQTLLWWSNNGRDWTQELRNIMIRYRNIGHNWGFSDRQRLLMGQYYEANQFLLECLNSNCQISPSVSKEIQETLLLPHAR